MSLPRPAAAALLLVAVSLSGCVGGIDVPGMASDGAGDDHAAHDHASHGNGTHGTAHAGGTHAGMDGTDGMGDHGGHDQTGMMRPPFAEGEGRVPTAEDARSMPQLSRIRIVGDEGFRPANGVVSGNGTLADPYVIEGWYVTGDLMLQDTDACVVLRENYVGGQLTLNWNGICVHAHHNFVRDLRVNENIRRTGYATGGLLEHNLIEYVGQLRHYDGEFRHNTVGPGGPASAFDDVLETVPFVWANDPRVANIDGFNQGLIHHNTFHGSVDLDFHGHHHGTGFFAPHSHYHGDNESREMPHDHTRRWTSVSFTDNTVLDEEGYGLRYEDRAHAGDDRTANSESEETLDEDHVHRTQIHILRNTVEGAGIWIDVFNADDRRHPERNDGWLHVGGNTVLLHERDPGPLGIYGTYESQVGILVQTAKELELRLADNHLRVVRSGDDGDLLDVLTPQPHFRAIDVDRVTDGHLAIVGNTAQDFNVGVSAGRFEDVTWRLSGNDFGDAQEFEADDSVPMPER